MRRRRFIGFTTVTVILLGLLIFFNTSATVRFVRGRILSAVVPVIHPFNTVRVWGIAMLGSTQDAVSDGMKEKLDVASAALERLGLENDRLRSALAFKERNKVSLKGASVLYYGRELGKEYLLIDRGGDDSIEKGSMVVDSDGLVIGTVNEVQDAFAKVGVATNSEEVFDAELLPSGIKAFAKGMGNRTFSLELLPQNAVMRAGDYVMAKGTKSSFLLGEVVRVETAGTGAFKQVRAILLSHPERTEEVFVVSTK